ncbi:MAG: ABC transporter substrate-binding protein [Dehalococcoidia bacterium]|nr:MAG: ABC transporter substrate-binding protein [Dehalococcoidia bacterium]
MRPVALVALVLLAACAPAAPATPAAPAQPEERRAANQVLRASDSGFPASASPETAASKMHIYAAQFDALLQFGERFAVQPAAAERWEMLPDGSAWRFTLRRDMTFSNGDKLTAADVEFTINHYISTRAPQSTVNPNVTGARVVDEYTVDLLTRVRDYSVLYTAQYLYLFPKRYYEATGRDQFQIKPIGTGPYELADYRPGELLVYRLRAGSPHPFRKPILTEIRWNAIPDTSTALAGLRAGELDLVVSPFTADQADQAKRDGLNLDVQLNTSQPVRFDKGALERTNSPMLDKRVRLAMNYAIDKEAIARTVYRGYGQPLGQIAPPDSVMYDESLKPFPYDPALAKRLLAEAGYPNGFRLNGPIDFSQSFQQPALMLAIQDYLRQVGIEAQIENRDFTTYYDIALGRGGRTRNELIAGNIADNNGFFSLQRSLLTCELPPAALIWCAPEFDRNYQLAQQEPDPQRRAQYLRAANKAYVDDVGMIFTVLIPQFTISTPKTRGVKLTTPFFWNADTIYKVE